MWRAVPNDPMLLGHKLDLVLAYDLSHTQAIFKARPVKASNLKNDSVRGISS